MDDNLKKIVRRLDSLQKTTDLLYADRSILEDILSRLTTVETALHLNKDHQKEVQKNQSADIAQVQHIVEDKIDEMKDKIDNQTIVVKSPTNILDRVKKKLGGES
jgi:cell fate (sporulation/competence/biofilm development) regulator YmcA (YheA/YmcA/DUF963 family)